VRSSTPAAWIRPAGLSSGGGIFVGVGGATVGVDCVAAARSAAICSACRRRCAACLHAAEQVRRARPRPWVSSVPQTSHCAMPVPSSLRDDPDSQTMAVPLNLSRNKLAGWPFGGSVGDGGGSWRPSPAPAQAGACEGFPPWAAVADRARRSLGVQDRRPRSGAVGVLDARRAVCCPCGAVQGGNPSRSPRHHPRTCTRQRSPRPLRRVAPPGGHCLSGRGAGGIALFVLNCADRTAVRCSSETIPREH
jgi:hypothetical protein